MIKYAMAMLAGAAIPTLAVYLTGGATATAVVIGVVMGVAAVVIPIAAMPKKTAKMLWVVTKTMEDIAAQYRNHQKAAAKDLSQAPVKMAMAASSQTRTVNPAIGDVVSALRNMGVSVKKGEALMEKLGREVDLTTMTFEEMFKIAVGIVAAERKAA
jgi:hypothetical protein